MAWSPGHRRVPPGLKKIVGSHMIALGIINQLTVRVFGNRDGKPTDIDVEDDTPIEEGEDIVLSLYKNSKSFGLNLSEMTTVELDAFKQVVDLAFQEARLVTVKRDEIAEEAQQNGDAIFYRSLRGDPKVTVFRRSQ